MRASVSKSLSNQTTRRQPNAVAMPLSRSDVSVQRYVAVGNVLYLTSVQADRFKRWFAPVFATWLRDHFDNPEAVAAAFNVRNSTAWNWWNGDNRASGDAVARMFIAFPEAAAWFQREWEQS
jgi:hypothetical protein